MSAVQTAPMGPLQSQWAMAGVLNCQTLDRKPLIGELESQVLYKFDTFLIHSTLASHGWSVTVLHMLLAYNRPLNKGKLFPFTPQYKVDLGYMLPRASLKSHPFSDSLMGFQIQFHCHYAFFSNSNKTVFGVYLIFMVRKSHGWSKHLIQYNYHFF